MKRKKTEVNELLEGLNPYKLLGDLGHAASLERLGPKVFERILWKGPQDGSKIALTFDDGPHELSTPALLDTLAAHDTPATFFTVGKHLENHPDIARQIAAAGHEIGNHTYSHALLSLLSRGQIRKEIKKAEEILSGLLGLTPKYLRPPNGLVSRRVLDIAEDMGYRVVIGDVYPRDPHRPGTARIVSRILSRCESGSIIILHDGGNTRRVDRSQTVAAVERLIPILEEKGFRFVTLSGLLD
jgi:peptidoglycan/xylan/chitin deacetylase (PgdA/CDA1 family)